MTKLTDEERKLVEQNHKLILKYLADHSATMEYEDWYDVLAVGLCKAAKAYNPDRGRFSTLAFACFKTEVGKVYRETNPKKQQMYDNMVYFDACVDEEGEYDGDWIENLAPQKYSVQSNVLSHCILEEYFEKRKIREQTREIFSLFQYGYTQREIADKLDCTVANVSRVKREFEEYLSGKSEEKINMKATKNKQKMNIIKDIQDTWNSIKTARA